MSYSDERQSIETYFKQKWGNTTTILFENTKQKPPKTVPFVRFTIIEGVGNQISIGPTQLHRNEGQVQVQVIVPKGKGNGEARELADMVVSAFRVKQLNTIQFRVPYLVNSGEFDEYFQINVICPFYRNEIYTLP